MTLFRSLRLLFFFSSVILCAEIPGQNKWNSLSTDDGLSQNTVSAIARDSFGRMWFATQDGLNLFDGRSVTVFYGPPTDTYSALVTSDISALLADDSGGVYVGMVNGSVAYFDSQSSSFQSLADSEKGPVSKIFFLPNGNIGFVAGGYLFLIADEGIQAIKPPFLSLVRTVRAAPLHTPDEMIVIGLSGESSLIKLHLDGSYDWVADLPGLDDSIHCYVNYGDDGYMVLTDGTIQRYSDQAVISSLLLPDGVVPTCAVEGPNGYIWIGTRGAGLFAIGPETGEILSFTTEDGLSDNTILSLYMDEVGTLWFGTWGAGVGYYHSGIVGFSHITPEYMALNSPDLMAIEELSDGRIAVGTLGGGVAIIDSDLSPETQILLDTESGFPSDFILSLHQDFRGMLWVGTVANGAYVVNPETLQTVGHFHADTQDPSNISSNRVHDIMTIDNRRVALALRDTETGRGSLTIIDGYELRVEEQYMIGTTWSILPGGNSGADAYIGTDAGLFEFHRERGTLRMLYPLPGDIADIRVWTTAWTNDDRIVVGTSGGAVILSPDGSIVKWTTHDGLPNNVVYSILPDSDDDIWITTNKGISAIDTESAQVNSFTTVNGLQDLEFNLNSGTILDDGRYLFGGVNGINIFKPEDLEVSFPVLDTYLAEIRVFNHIISPDEEWRGRIPLDRSVITAEEIVLRHDEDAISFAVGTSDFISPDSTRYRFRLVGLERAWVDAGTRNYRSYTNLKPGVYEFRYQATMTAAPWPEDYDRLRIIIKPPFSATWPFYLIVLLSIGVIFFLVVRYYFLLKKEIRERIRIQNRYMELTSTLENRVKQRTEHLEQAHKRLLESERLAALGPMMAGIAHEINTPVGVAVTGTTWMQEKVGEYLLSEDASPEVLSVLDSLKEPLDLVIRNLDRSSRLILNLKTAMVDQDDDHLVQTILPDYVEEIIVPLRLQNKNEKVAIEILTGEKFIIPLPRSALWHIITNLIQNSFAHAFEPNDQGQKEGHITIEIRRSGETLEIEYRDDGKGMNSEALSRSVEPFYTTNRVGGNTGLGMFIIQNIVYKNLGGEMKIESAPDEGVRILITFPLKLEDR